MRASVVAGATVMLVSQVALPAGPQAVAFVLAVRLTLKPAAAHPAAGLLQVTVRPGLPACSTQMTHAAHRGHSPDRKLLQPCDTLWKQMTVCHVSPDKAGRVADCLSQPIEAVTAWWLVTPSAPGEGAWVCALLQQKGHSGGCSSAPCTPTSLTCRVGDCACGHSAGCRHSRKPEAVGQHRCSIGDH